MRSTPFTLRKPVRRPGPITTKPDRWSFGRKKGEGRRNGPWQGVPLLFLHGRHGAVWRVRSGPTVPLIGRSRSAEDDAPLPPSALTTLTLDNCPRRTSIPAKMTAVGPKTKALNPLDPVHRELQRVTRVEFALAETV